MFGYIITSKMCGVDLWIVPEQCTRYEVHKAAVYPFRCVAEQVAARMKKFATAPDYKVMEIKIKDSDHG